MTYATMMREARGWQKLARGCPDLPQSYYDTETCDRTPAEKLIKYYSTCGKDAVIWLRIGD